MPQALRGVPPREGFMLSKVRKLGTKVLNARKPGESLPDFTRRFWILGRRAWSTNKGKIDAADVRAVSQLLKSGRIAYGPGVRSFQNQFAKLYGVRRAVANTSGTAAIHVALAMVDLEPGDEVIVPPITDMGSVLPILAQNAIPIFADIDPETWNLDPDAVESRITARTRAVIAVHLFGNPCDLDRLRTICDRHGLALIEDCAQAHWAHHRDRLVGTIGDIGAFSLQWTKHITTCEGGMTITDNPEYGERGRLFVDKGWNRGAAAGARQYPIFGLNYRMSEMAAALGCSQLRKVKTVISKRQANARQLIEMLSDIPGLRFQRVLEGCRSAYWQIGLTVDPDAPFTVDALAGCLFRRKILCGAHYIGKPIHECHAPLLQRRVYGRSDLPFSLSDRSSDLDYRKMKQPVAEDVLRRLAVLGVPTEHFSSRQVAEIGKEICEVVEELSDPAKMQVKPAARHKIGIIGCGKIALEHGESLRPIESVAVRAIADPDENALKTVGSRFGVASRYADYRQMLDKEDLDIVLVLTWPTLHAEIVSAAAGKGIRAILCEKPIASNLGEGRAMLEVAKRGGSLLVLGHQHRFNPHLEQARKLVQAGEIGTIRHAWAHCRSSLINNGSHVIDGLLYLLGEPKLDWVLGQIHRSSGQTDRGQPVEDGSIGLICFRDGVRANIEMGETAVPDIGWHLYGDKGKIDVGMLELTVVGVSHPKPKRYEYPRVESMTRQVEELVACLEGREKQHRGDARLGYAAMEILIGLLESARTGDVVHAPVAQMAYPLDLAEPRPAQGPQLPNEG